uniref:putative uncharacterized protein PQLC2L n=1 Tax=Odobenus rosmarus divergens TaxID=9708 RepID=UPI00063C2B4C|nr:PREDICTED: putative uncharacterized protein PQLC2L [Odobenus rosmarus divergens]
MPPIQKVTQHSCCRIWEHALKVVGSCKVRVANSNVNSCMGGLSCLRSHLCMASRTRTGVEALSPDFLMCWTGGDLANFIGCSLTNQLPRIIFKEGRRALCYMYMGDFMCRVARFSKQKCRTPRTSTKMKFGFSSAWVKVAPFLSFFNTDGTRFRLPPAGCNYDKDEGGYTNLRNQLQTPLVSSYFISAVFFLVGCPLLKSARAGVDALSLSMSGGGGGGNENTTWLS